MKNLDNRLGLSEGSMLAEPAIAHLRSAFKPSSAAFLVSAFCPASKVTSSGSNTSAFSKAERDPALSPMATPRPRRVREAPPPRPPPPLQRGRAAPPPLPPRVGGAPPGGAGEAGL